MANSTFDRTGSLGPETRGRKKAIFAENIQEMKDIVECKE